MNDKIIERLLEVNEKRSEEADKKFYVAAGLLFISMIFNFLQFYFGGEVVIDNSPSFKQSDNNINKVNGK